MVTKSLVLSPYTTAASWNGLVEAVREEDDRDVLVSELRQRLTDNGVNAALLAMVGQPSPRWVTSTSSPITPPPGFLRACRIKTFGELNFAWENAGENQKKWTRGKRVTVPFVHGPSGS